MKLSKDFELSEFTRSDKAEELNIPNEPSADQINSLIDLVNKVIQPLRDLIGKPVIVLSGFRSEAANEAVGGEPNSQHTKGEAADLRVNGYPPEAVAKILVKAWKLKMSEINFDQLIVEPTWIHVSYRRGRNRNELLKAIPAGIVNGKQKYIYQKLDVNKWID